MSEVASRPAPTRGRGTTRGRGGFRGGARTRQTNGDSKDTRSDETDQGELGELKKKYSGQLKTLNQLFADWTDVDLLLALEEFDGDLDRTIDHISEGNVSQFSDVKKKAKDRSRSKVDAQPDSGSRPPRGRGGAVDAGRGRGRTDRGRGAPRTGRGGQHASESRGVTSPTSIPTAESSAWEENGAWGASSSPAPVAAPKAAEPVKPAAAAAAPPQKTWASMFATPKPEVKASKPPVVEPTPAQEAGAVPSSDISSGYVEVTHSDADTEPAPQLGESSIISQEPSESLEQPSIEIDDSNITIPPTKDKLTEDNVENLPDVSQPAPVGTAASTVESSRGPDSTAISVVAQPTAPVPIGRQAVGGFATTALKATTPQGRSASFQRRLLEQQEAVVMPGNHAVDRAAVQFGSLGLNGDINSLDVDEDREELETRAQPPQHSPVAQPKTALPPAPRQETAPQEPTPVKPAPGLPQPATHPTGAQQAAGQQAGQGYNQFGRYGQTHDAASQKQHYDPFGQQQQQTPYDSYSAQSQAPSQPQQAATSHLGGGFPSATNDYYSEQQRNAYQNYYGNQYGQQQTASQQETQPRTGSAFGAGTESSFATTQSQQPPSSRFGTENQASSTPASSATPSSAQGPNAHHQGGYQYGHPYYGSQYYQQYMNQYQGYGAQGYGAPFAGAKGGMYGHPQHYAAAYDQHSSSPAAQAGNFGGRESGLGAGADYARSGSAQPAQTQSAAPGFEGSQFGRSPGQTYGQQYGQNASTEDSLKPFAEKSTAGSLGQPGRPTSATNSNPGGLPPPQSHQAFGGYPSQFGQMQGGQAASFGGLNSGAAAPAAGGYGQQYGQYNNQYQQYGQGNTRGGWGNYGQGGAH